jgi:L-ascorbate metabolism protein UlaG (beta-lactamase superfamily)
MKITYLGTNTLLIKKDETSILVDPHFTRPGWLNLVGKIRPDPHIIAKYLARFGIHRLDGILLTHTHYDHALDAAEVVRQAGGVLLGSESAVHLAQGAALDEKSCVQVIPDQAYTLGTTAVRFHPARHISFPAPLGWLMPAGGKITQALSPPAYFWDYQAGKTFAVQVDRILIFGSAGFLPGHYRNLGVKTIILGIGGLDLKSPAYLQQLYNETVLASGAEQVLLSHWDNFFRPVDSKLRVSLFARRSISQITKLSHRYGHRVHQLEFGQTLSID